VVGETISFPRGLGFREDEDCSLGCARGEEDMTVARWPKEADGSSSQPRPRVVVSPAQDLRPAALFARLWDSGLATAWWLTECKERSLENDAARPRELGDAILSRF
jgi:hypothetical protein